MASLQRIAEAVENGKNKEAVDLINEALRDGVDPQTILKDGMMAAMEVIGQRFRDNEIFVPEMLVAARAMKKGVAVLQPYLASKSSVQRGKVIIGTVEGDLHDIGKNLVAMMLEGVGFEVIDLGVDVPPGKFVEELKRNPDTKIIAISALLTTTIAQVRLTIEALKEAGLRDQVTIMVGGAPVTQSFADSVGADAYTPDAGSAAEWAKNRFSVLS
ncbi:MAG: cobalamin-binding protein [Clostridiales bacterium]|jgi:corrinoid protein of di/trimethylamine methyltransferase|nr:cobalamin-binding protein [Clostridiales bacterium]